MAAHLSELPFAPLKRLRCFYFYNFSYGFRRITVLPHQLSESFTPRQQGDRELLIGEYRDDGKLYFIKRLIAGLCLTILFLDWMPILAER
jgi:hypothetical protein